MPKMPLQRLRLHLQDECATNALAEGLAQAMGLAGGTGAFDAHAKAESGHGLLPISPARSGSIHLKGDLGAGKTAFSRAFLRACGVTGRIKSPSYALLETYKVSNLYLYHLDFYRFSDPREWLDAGFRDLIRDDALVLIEWPEKAQDLLPPPDILISLEYSDSGRDVEIAAFTDRGQTWLNAIVPQKGQHPSAP